MTFTQPLELQKILIDFLAGGEEFTIFMLLAFVVITILAARFKMPNIVFGGIIFVFIMFVGLGTAVGLNSNLSGVAVIAFMILSLWVTSVITRLVST